MKSEQASNHRPGARPAVGRLGGWLWGKLLQLFRSGFRSQQSMVRGTGLVAILTLISRILGLIRDVIVAYLFGAGFHMDAFVVAFRIPNLLRSLVAEGGLTSAFVPVFASQLKQGHAAAQKTLSSTTALLLITTFGLSLLGMIFAREIVDFTAPGFNDGSDKTRLCISLARVMLPYIMFVSLVAMLNGALSTVKIYGASPMAQIAMNIVLILGALAAKPFDARTGVMLLSWSVIVGGVVGILVQFPSLKRAQFSLRPAWQLITPATRQIMYLMLPAVLGAAIYQISILIVTQLASVLRPGSISWLYYADRVAQLPIGVFTVALASVLLPSLSNAAAEKNHSAFSDNLVNALRYTSFCIIPVSVGLFYFAEPLTRLVFEHWRFTRTSTIGTSLAVQAMCLGLWGVSCSSMAMRAFIARKDTLTPALTGVASLVLGICISLIFMGPPQVQAGGWQVDTIAGAQAFLTAHFYTLNLGHVGLALSSGLAQTAAFILLVLLLERRGAKIAWQPFLSATFKTLAASAGMYAVFAVWKIVMPLWYLNLLTGAPLGVLAFILCCKLLKSREWEETFAAFKRLASRR